MFLRSNYILFYFLKKNNFSLINFISTINTNKLHYFHNFLFNNKFNKINLINFYKFFYIYNNFLFNYFNTLNFNIFNSNIFNSKFINFKFKKVKLFSAESESYNFITNNFNLFQFIFFKNKFFFLNSDFNHPFNEDEFFLNLSYFFKVNFYLSSFKKISFFYSYNFFNVLIFYETCSDEEEEVSIDFDEIQETNYRYNETSNESDDSVEFSTELTGLDFSTNNENYELCDSENINNNSYWSINVDKNTPIFDETKEQDLIEDTLLGDYFVNFIDYDYYDFEDDLFFNILDNLDNDLFILDLELPLFTDENFKEEIEEGGEEEFYDYEFNEFVKPKRRFYKYNMITYKYLLKELINFENNSLFYKLLPFNQNFYGFISLSYYNFYSNTNFFDDRVFERLFSSENYKDYVFNNFSEMNLNFNESDLYVYNNHYPILLNNDLVNILFFSKKNKLDYVNYTKFYKFYISNLFEIILKKSIFFKLDTNFFKKYNHFLQVDKIVSSVKNSPNINFSKLFCVSEMVEIIWYSFEFKDLNILSNWLIKTLAQMNLKNHKKFLNLFGSIVKNNVDEYQHFLKVNGFFFRIKGKISLTGNAKKKQMKFGFGKLNISDKKNKIIVEKNISKTDYGVLGFTMILTY